MTEKYRNNDRTLSIIAWIFLVCLALISAIGALTEPGFIGLVLVFLYLTYEVHTTQLKMGRDFWEHHDPCPSCEGKGIIKKKGGK